MYLKNIPLDEIVAPTRDEKLHPNFDEDPEEWDEFQASIGDEPDKPLDVRRNGDGYELIDGDRRLLALRKNNETDEYDIETVQCRVFEEMSDEEFYLRRIRANEHRRDSDPEQRAMYAAQFCAPWLLPPHERWDVERVTQSEFEATVGLAEGSGGAARWLEPQRNKQPLRDVLGSKKYRSGRRVSDKEIEKIDEIVKVLQKGTSKGKNVLVGGGDESYFADNLDSMEGVSLGEVLQVVEKASDERWKSDKVVETLKKEFAEDTSGQPDSAGRVTDQGAMSGSDPFEDNSEEEHYDEPNQPGSIETDADDPGPEPEAMVLNDPVIEVDWTDHLDDDDLPGDKTVAKLSSQNYVTLNVQGDAAVAIQIIAALADESNDDVMSKFFAPGMVEAAVAFIEDQTA